MSEEITLEGMSLAPGVVETIVSIAANDVEGVASVGSFPSNSLIARLTSHPSTSSIEVANDDDGKLLIKLHIEVKSGYVFPDVAANLRRAIADALLTQAGVEVGAIDIYIDGIQFS